MIIVSQSKSKIINLNNIQMLFLTRVNNKHGNVQSIQVNARGSYDCNLGEYKKEERAKEVLEKISNKYEVGMSALGKNTFSFVNEFVYEMPEE